MNPLWTSVGSGGSPTGSAHGMARATPSWWHRPLFVGLLTFLLPGLTAAQPPPAPEPTTHRATSPTPLATLLEAGIPPSCSPTTSPA